MAIRMRPLNYGTGFPVTPYGLEWASRDLRGLGESGYKPTPVPAVAELPPHRGVSRPPRALRRLVHRATGQGSLVRSPSLRVVRRAPNPGRFGKPVLRKMRKTFDTWQKYQGLSGHPTLSSTNPRYASWRGRMYGGLAGVEAIFGTLLQTGADYYAGSLQAKTAQQQADAAAKAARQQAKMLAAQDAAARAADAAARAGTTKTTLYVVGGVAALVALALIVRKK